MKLKDKLPESFTMDDCYYDLFEGGYLNPKDYLESGVKEVEKAIQVIREYIDLLDARYEEDD